MIKVKVYEKGKSWSSDIVFDAPTYADVCLITAILEKYGSNIGKVETVEEYDPENDAASGTVSA